MRAILSLKSEAHAIQFELDPAGSRHLLAVEREGSIDLAARVVAASTRWGATPRQAEVLGLLALGQANKTIACTLGCAASTIEIHVTALLAKSGCESRCEMVSRIWLGSDGQRHRAPMSIRGDAVRPGAWGAPGSPATPDRQDHR
jgi:DNA-binding CsgD family transcriptional regulator